MKAFGALGMVCHDCVRKCQLDFYELYVCSFSRLYLCLPRLPKLISRPWVSVKRACKSRDEEEVRAQAFSGVCVCINL